jgi:pimeloyl-ACP methyl ester carboxylesterase
MIQPAAESTVRLPDGRRLGYAAFGDPQGAPILHFHGAVSSRWEGLWFDAAARSVGARLVCVDRPGIGDSDPGPGRRILDWPADVSALADHLGFARFGVLGVSGGGPFALACGALAGARIGRVALVAGAAPIHDPAVFALLARPQRLLFAALPVAPGLGRFLLGALGLLPPSLAGLRVAAICTAIGGLAPADRAAIRDPAIRALADACPPHARSATFARGSRGVVSDGVLCLRPWGFDVASVQVPVDLWYGEDDRIIPPGMGRWLAARLPRAAARYLPGEGHLSLVLRHAPDVLAPLVAAVREGAGSIRA